MKYLDDLKNTNYELLGCEKDKEGYYVFTRDHFLSLVSYYINNNYAEFFTQQEVPAENKQSEKSILSTLLIKQCDYLRGLIIDKTILSTIDVEEIFKTLNISKNCLSLICNSKSFIATTYEMETLEQYNNISEMNIFRYLNYSFLDNKVSQLICQGDLEQSFNEGTDIKSGKYPLDLHNDFIENQLPKIEGINVSLSLYPQIENIKSIKQENKVIIEQKTKILFKNLITNVVHAYDNNIILLKELDLLSSFSYNNEFTKKIIENLEDISVSRSLINEMKELISILDNTTCDDSIETDNVNNDKLSNNQKKLTNFYVQSHKNDKAETLASTVIDNVYNYLLPLQSVNETINKNQIGKDLVDLGVKKTRKSKGYVYGIDDSSHSNIKNVVTINDLVRESINNNDVTMDFKIDQW